MTIPGCSRISARRSRTSGMEISVLQDLQGPKIRIGDLSVPSIELRAGETLVITTDPIVGGPGRVSTTYGGLPAMSVPVPTYSLTTGNSG